MLHYCCDCSLVMCGVVVGDSDMDVILYCDDDREGVVVVLCGGDNGGIRHMLCYCYAAGGGGMVVEVVLRSFI